MGVDRRVRLPEWEAKPIVAPRTVVVCGDYSSTTEGCQLAGGRPTGWEKTSQVLPRRESDQLVKGRSALIAAHSIEKEKNQKKKKRKKTKNTSKEIIRTFTLGNMPAASLEAR